MSTIARRALASRLDLAAAAGQLRPGTHTGVVSEIFVGALVFRLLAHEEIDDVFIATLATTVLGGVGESPD